MSQAPSMGRFVGGISFVPVVEPEPTNTEIHENAATRQKRPVASAQVKATASHPAIKKSTLPQLVLKPKIIADIYVDLSDHRMKSFCQSMRINTDQPCSMGIVAAWTSNGHILFRAVAESFQAIFKCGDSPLMTRMLIYGSNAFGCDDLIFPVAESYLTEDEIIELFSDRTFRVSV